MDEKLLIIRFSSLGDIIQALSIPQAFRSKYPHAQVHWLLKQEFSFLPQFHPHVEKVISFPAQAGLFGLIRLAIELRKENYTHIYDAHNNLRSWIFCFFLRLFKRPQFIRRSKDRWKRFLFFKLKKRHVFLMPYRAQYSYLRPLLKWLEKTSLPAPPQLFFSEDMLQFVEQKIRVTKPFIALVPSAAWRMKRWPQEHWQRLIEALPKMNFVVLGGPLDDFCQKYEQLNPHRVQNLAGKLTFIESCAVIKIAALTISGDTGLLHAADQLGVPAIALIGPTAFGYPTRSSSEIMEVAGLSCKPCSKDGSGRCQQKVFRKCLVDLNPIQVAQKALEILQSKAFP